MHRRTKIALATLGILVISTLAASVLLDQSRVDAQISGATTDERVLLNYPMEYNFRQSQNSCGPYSAAAALRVVWQREVDSEEIAAHIPWRVPNGPTMPWGIVATLRDVGVSAEGYDTSHLSDTERATFLRENIAAGHPVIILGGAGNNLAMQHYITVVGFDGGYGEFYVYDSAHARHDDLDDMTRDDNGNPPGNRTLTNDELLAFWNDGGVYGLYDHHAIVASK